MRNFIYIVCLLVSTVVLGQEPSAVAKEPKISLKFYGQVMADAQQETNQVTFPRFNPGASFHTKNNNFHELSFSALKFSKSRYAGNEFQLHDYTHTSFNIGLRYSYNHHLFNSKKLELYLGSGANLFTSYHAYTPNNSSAFSGYDYVNGVELNITPRLIWNFNEKWYLDVHVPVNVYEHTWSTSNWDNPLLPVDARQNSHTKGEIFPNRYTVNVGVGIRF